MSKAHTAFENSMQRLEMCYSGRLRKTESHSLNLRKKLAPRIARLALESRSLRDFVMHGQLSQIVCLRFLYSGHSNIKLRKFNLHIEVRVLCM